METKHTLSDVLNRLILDVTNMNSFLYSLENVLDSTSDNVSVTQTDAAGTKTTINVPSFGYLKGKIEDINTRFETLLSTNNDVIGITSANGDVRKFQLKKTSQVLSDLDSVSNAALAMPSTFKVKNNSFFESFLNPLLYVSLDLTGLLTDEMDQFAVKKIIINAVNNTTAATYFDTNYKGKNNISLATLKSDLDANGIDYFEDDNIVDIDTAINRFKGTFDVLRILNETGNQTLNNNTTVSVERIRYKLSTLNYTDVLSGFQNTKILAVGDTLVTNGDSEYVILSVNATDTEVVLQRTFGINPITIGAAELRIKPVPYRAPEINVNLGFNERVIVFLKPISKSNNITADVYSNGVAFYSNDLTIPLQDNSTTTLGTYYNNFVSDFGLILLNMAKEKKIPAIIAATPVAPTLDAGNFKVVQVDKHIQDDKNIANITSTIQEKAQVEQEVLELNKQISDIKAQITTTSKTPQEAQRLQKQLTDSLTARDQKVTNLSTLVTNATLQISTTPQFITNRQYAVRGFWQIPTPLSTAYGMQNIVQFRYRYRYLSAAGNQPAANQQTFLDTDGTQKAAAFSPWVEVLTKPRSKTLNTTTGLYDWATENVSDPNTVNTNQLDIPIRKGEIVEIQVQSLSEAGWPENPATSAWSTSVQIPFPADISSTEEGTVISQKLFADKTRLDFEKTLTSRGVDTHIANQFTTGDKFYAHKAQDIASGFYNATGGVIDLFQQLTTLSNTLTAIQQSIALDKGVIKVSITDSDGNSSDISNGDTVSLFAGYYRDLIKDTTGGTTVYNEGRVITKQYSLTIQNTSATQLELISLLFGGIDTLCDLSDPIAHPTDDYHVNRRYDVVPLGVNKNQTAIAPALFKQIPSTQSGQVKSQFIYSRDKNYGLSEELYVAVSSANDYVSTAYNFQGQTPSGASAIVPYDWGHYLPYDPSYPSSATASAKVWAGTITSGAPDTGGKLSEFCISKDHPYLKSFTGTVASFDPAVFYLPAFDSPYATSAQKYLPFAHSLHFESSVAEAKDNFGVSYYKQASRVTPAAPVSTVGATNNYPIKLGFTPNDEYLIGKYSCGSYLYMFPVNYEAISVTGNFPAISSTVIKTGTENAINIPILFQFRCSDKLGYIGGYRTSGTLNNIKYQKKIGIDIIVKNDVPFSFDLEISGQYTKETSLDAPLVQSKGTIKTF